MDLPKVTLFTLLVGAGCSWACSLRAVRVKILPMGSGALFTCTSVYDTIFQISTNASYTTAIALSSVRTQMDHTAAAVEMVFNSRLIFIVV